MLDSWQIYFKMMGIASDAKKLLSKKKKILPGFCLFNILTLIHSHLNPPRTPPSPPPPPLAIDE